MIATIGSLVQATETRTRWLVAYALYAVSCCLAGALLGAAVSLAEHWANPGGGSFAKGGTALGMGILAVAYSSSDLRLIWLPRPRFSSAVPVTWWRKWGAYRASIAYGLALGTGLCTRVGLGSVYVLFGACLFAPDVIYGAFVMGSFGAGRAASLLAAAIALSRGKSLGQLIACPLLDEETARNVVAIVTALAGGAMVGAAVVTLHASGVR